MRKTTEADLSRHPELEGFDGYLWNSEGARLAYLAERVPAGQCIVEVGSWRGKSACFLATGSKAGNRVKVHCVDAWDLGVPRGPGVPPVFWRDPAASLEVFRRQVRQAKVATLVVEHKGYSVEEAAKWSGPPIGLLFLDGDHTYEAVRSDLAAWVPHVAPGGWVCFHDYTKFEPNSRQFPGCVQAIDEWVAVTPHVEATRTAKVVCVRLPGGE